MQEDRAWDRIVDAIDTKFGLINHGRSQRKLEDDGALTEYISFVVFNRDGQEFKVERIQGPAIIDRKTMGARRAGAVTRIENVYDPDEVSFRTNLYRKSAAGDWESVDPGSLGL